MKLKYDQTTARQVMLGIARLESPEDGNRQETRTARTEESPGKAKCQDKKNRQEKRSGIGRENAKRRGNAKEKRAHLGLIDGASDSVGNHVGTGEY